MTLMEIIGNNKKKVGDGYDTLRVKADLKARILKLQNEYFTQASKKISVTELLREALDARAKLGNKSKPARA